jgi:hypothetical protein
MEKTKKHKLLEYDCTWGFILQLKDVTKIRIGFFSRRQKL